MKKDFYLIFAFFALVLLCFTTNSCKHETPAPAPLDYKTLVVKKDSGVMKFDFAAVTQSSNMVDVFPRVGGYLEKVCIKEGTHISKGEVMFIIDDDDYRQAVVSAEAAVLVAEAQLSSAQLEVEKVTPLVQKGIVSDFQLKTAQSNVKAAQGQLANAKAQKEQALINLSHTKVTSPTNGYCSKVNIHEGNLVKTSDMTPMTTIAATGDLVAYFSVSETLYQLGGINMADFPKVQFQLANGEVYEKDGVIQRGSAIVNPNTGTILLKAVFPNADDKIPSGMSGTVLVPIPVSNVILIPQSATFEQLDKTMVAVVKSDNTISHKAVEIAGVQGDKYIITKGLDEGDRIVIEGVSKLRLGQTIHPVE